MAFANNVKSALENAVSIGATTVDVTKASAPYNDPPVRGKLTIMDSLTSPTAIEIISYTGRTDNTTYWTLTGVSKAQESTTDQAWGADSDCIQSITAIDAVERGLYASRTISADVTLDADTRYETGTDTEIASGVTVTVPASSILVSKYYDSLKIL